MTNLNYYKVLRLQPTATPKEIQKAFIELSILFDGSKDPLTCEVMEIIREAFSVLREPDTRANYDLELVMTKSSQAEDGELTEAEKIINSWQPCYTQKERKYIEKIHFLNQTIKVIVAIGAAVFLWLVVSLQFDLAMIIVLVLAVATRIVRSIYRMNNPSSAVELWASIDGV